MNSISAKLSLLYIFLALFNIAFFTITTFENQIDLITQIKKYETREAGTNISLRLENLMNHVRENRESFPSPDTITAYLQENITAYQEEVIIFTEDRQYVSEWSADFPFSPRYLEDAGRAFANHDVLNEPFYPDIRLESREILFFVPLATSLPGFENFIFLFRLEMQDIDNRLGTLYKLMLIFILVIAAIHLIFAVFLNGMIISPLKTLTTRSLAISRGDYSSRVISRSRDEIGKLAAAFNAMAGSIEEKITQLDRRNRLMHKELQMAARVQQSIYPAIRSTPLFDLAVHHRPYMEVSGDYHNVIPLDENHYGVIIADVSGHGVSAALITMMIKDQFEEIAPRYTDSATMLEYINEIFANLLTDFDKFFTAFYLIVDSGQVVTFTNAAHPRAFVIRPGASGFKILDTPGIFIGMPTVQKFQFQSKSIRLLEGDKIILYTDGITESLNSERGEYSAERLQQTALHYAHSPCAEMVQEILADLEKFSHKDFRRDDETLVILEMKGKRKEPAGE